MFWGSDDTNEFNLDYTRGNYNIQLLQTADKDDILDSTDNDIPILTYLGQGAAGVFKKLF